MSMMAQMCSMKKSSARRMSKQYYQTLAQKVSSYVRYGKAWSSHRMHAVPQDVLHDPLS